MVTMVYVDEVPGDVNPPSEAREKGCEGFPLNSEAQKQSAQNEEKTSWWPNCMHARYTKLAVRKFADRIVILWKCRKCPKETIEVIDINMNQREVFIKSTKSALPRRYNANPT